LGVAQGAGLLQVGASTPTWACTTPRSNPPRCTTNTLLLLLLACVCICCRWEARIGRGAGGRPAAGGRKYTYLGLYDTEIEAAMAYDRAAVKLKGLAAITNFDLSMYLDELNPGEGLLFVEMFLWVQVSASV
jgi:hypothetical protein